MKRRRFLNASTGIIGLGLLGCGDDDLMTDAGPIGAEDAAVDVSVRDSGSADSGSLVDSGAPDIGSVDAGADAARAMCVSVTFIMGDEHANGPHAEGLVFPAEDVIAGVPVQYDITGASRHPHTLDVTAEHFAALAAGEAVTIRSSFDSRHVHDVTLQCMS